MKRTVAAPEAAWEMPPAYHALNRTDRAAPLHFGNCHYRRGTGLPGQPSAGLVLPLRDVCPLTTSLSDSSATELLVGTFELEAASRTLADLSFRHPQRFGAEHVARPT